MDGKLSIRYLQNYIASKDCHPERLKDYCLKLMEEVGELSEAVRKNLIRKEDGPIKGTVDEELWDVMYYVLAIANLYGIDLEQAALEKEAINNEKYHNDICLELGR